MNKGTGQDGRITLGDARAALAAGKQARVTIRDGSVGGLYLRAGSRGAMWAWEFKPPGRDANGRRHPTRHLRLGSVAAISPDSARQAAAQARQAVLLGQDPQAARRTAQGRAVAPGWVQVREDYLAYLAKRLPNPRSNGNEVGYITAVFELLDPRRPLREFGIADVYRLIDNLPNAGVLARQRLGALGRLFDWARAREITDTANPVRLLPRGARPKKSPPRRRVLSLSELGMLWHGADTLMPLERDLLQLMIALPLRRSECASLEWNWIDAKADLISLPGRKMKNGEDHSIPLGALARPVLDQIADGTWPTTERLFQTANARTADWGRFKRRIDAAVPLSTPWVFHDFRRSFVSILAEHRHAEAVLDMLIAHRASSTRSGSLGIYQVSRRWPEQKKAMLDWGMLLKGAIGGEEVRLSA